MIALRLRKCWQPLLSLRSNNFQLSTLHFQLHICGHDGIGRHAGFRFLCSDALGFKSPCPHHNWTGNWYNVSITGPFHFIPKSLVNRPFLQNRGCIWGSAGGWKWAAFLLDGPTFAVSAGSPYPIVSKNDYRFTQRKPVMRTAWSPSRAVLFFGIRAFPWPPCCFWSGIPSGHRGRPSPGRSGYSKSDP